MTAGALRVELGDILRRLAVLLAAAVALAGSSAASELVYTPINPTFGGNPGNSSHLLAVAGAQRTATALDAPKPNDTSSEPPGSTSQNNVDQFIAQLEWRLLSSLAAQVTDAIFGENPQDHGTITFGSTIVGFDRNSSTIDLTITDTTTGEVTLISVPQLVVN